MRLLLTLIGIATLCVGCVPLSQPHFDLLPIVKTELVQVSDDPLAYDLIYTLEAADNITLMSLTTQIRHNEFQVYNPQQVHLELDGPGTYRVRLDSGLLNDLFTRCYAQLTYQYEDPETGKREIFASEILAESFTVSGDPSTFWRLDLVPLPTAQAAPAIFDMKDEWLIISEMGRVSTVTFTPEPTLTEIHPGQQPEWGRVEQAVLHENAVYAIFKGQENLQSHLAVYDLDQQQWQSLDLLGGFRGAALSYATSETWTIFSGTFFAEGFDTVVVPIPGLRYEFETREWQSFELNSPTNRPLLLGGLAYDGMNAYLTASDGRLYRFDPSLDTLLIQPTPLPTEGELLAPHMVNDQLWLYHLKDTKLSQFRFDQPFSQWERYPAPPYPQAMGAPLLVSSQNGQQRSVFFKKANEYSSQSVSELVIISGPDPF